MNIFRKYILPCAAVLFLTAAFLLQACTKETAKLPYTQLESFTIADAAGKPLSAAITGQDIVIYWPYEQTMPATITPQLTVTDKATVAPASGVAVPFVAGTSFTVTAENGTTTQYHLKIVSSQPQPVINLPAGSFINTFPGSPGRLSAYYLLPDAVRTKLSFISTKGDKIPLRIDSIRRDMVYYTTPATLDTGMYKLMVQSGNHTVNPATMFLYMGEAPELDTYGDLRIKKGQTFTLKGQRIKTIKTAQLLANGDLGPSLEVVGSTATTVTLRVPDNMPAGTYDGIFLGYRFYLIEDVFGAESPIVVE
ncbi:hypothetical protein [Chitinophaga nivalis]|uniref:DUF5018 domain-containing protein n=1 Tax=Chitinophaga nivalis TaxID=2991709 RepID=A0ABT3IT94_9BACT|nr:hypothetical protein [Chitinophaga nivalis]MCW3463114.1 hypothetical protein [Chitinophaga nivalis]MCW3487196.1 hypothetical protein [Chitinophaga nivalis]